MPRLHSGAATDRPATTELLLLPIPEVVKQQPQEIHLANIHKTSPTETHKDIHMLEHKRRSDVKSQTLPINATSSQVSGSSAEPLLGN